MSEKIEYLICLAIVGLSILAVGCFFYNLAYNPCLLPANVLPAYELSRCLQHPEEQK